MLLTVLEHFGDYTLRTSVVDVVSHKENFSFVM